MENRNESFAKGLNVYKLIWIFVIGSFLGFVVETIWYFTRNGFYVCRKGVIYSPISPIYGIGAILVTILLYRIRNKNAAYIVACSGIIGSVFEYLCSVLQEIVFGTRAWNYSNTPFNINGRVNLRMAIVWGFFGLIFIRCTYPYLSDKIEKIPNKIGRILSIAMMSFLIFDMSISIVAVHRQKERRLGNVASNVIEKTLDKWYPDEYLNSIFTKVKVVEKNTELATKRVNKEASQ